LVQIRKDADVGKFVHAGYEDDAQIFVAGFEDAVERFKLTT
jgi:hypothetical protein